MNVPGHAGEVCVRYLAEFDRRHPGLLAGLYLVGSVALDDVRPGSDIDFVTVTTRPVTLDEVAPIHASVARTRARPFFDGLYVTAEELRTIPTDSVRGVAVLEGRALDDNRAERHPVTWLTLARHGLAVRGPAAADLHIAADLPTARAYSRANLVAYWRPWIASRRHLLSRGGVHSLTADAAVWSVLGVSRLHALIDSGQILSKTAAGRSALEVFPRHRAILDCVLALRSGEPAAYPGGPLSRRHAMLAFLDDAIDSLAEGSGH